MDSSKVCAHRIFGFDPHNRRTPPAVAVEYRNRVAIPRSPHASYRPRSGCRSRCACPPRRRRNSRRPRRREPAGRLQRRSGRGRKRDHESAVGRDPPLRRRVRRDQAGLRRSGRRPQADAVGDQGPAARPRSAHTARIWRKSDAEAFDEGKPAAPTTASASKSWRCPTAR